MLRRSDRTVAAGQVPFGLLDGSRIATEVSAGETITYDVDLNDTFARHLRAIQGAGARS